MTEHEAIKFLTGYLDSVVYKEKCVEAHKLAINALEEVQQYRTLEKELKEVYHANVDIPALMHFFIETIFKGEKHEGFCILTNEDAAQWEQYRAIGTPEELQTMKEHGGFTGVELANIAAMQMKLKEYEAIGAPGECRVAVEKQKAKKPVTYKGTNIADCPICGATVRGISKHFGDWCSHCGHKLDWSDEE